MIRNLILILSFSGVILAQEIKNITIDHPLSAESIAPDRDARLFVSHLNVLAVMVEFAADDDDRTSGNGTFDLSTPSRPYMDAPPHTNEYFRHHLSFVSNYFAKVSDGKLTISTTLLDTVFRLPQQMRYYSPAKTSETNAELGLLMRDSWRLVDSLTRLWGTPVSYSDYDAFIIFHAGVGRDIDLVSIYGYDPTPFNIPSLYVSLSSLRLMFDDAQYPGVVVNNGADTIKNSIIIPETESHEEIPFPLGINGLIAASIGSHLGLPDLFNTKNGRSGIGRFGLMDGQAIFSWNGAFPPEPSAWEKYYLGWIDPITVNQTEGIYTFPAVGNSPDTVYRVLMSGREYLFVENRNRDANRDGAVVRLAVGSDIVTKIWARDTVGFTEDDQDSLAGVVIDVDEYDWSLPGGYEDDVDVLHDGGILIWHVDERIIDENIFTNSVNADEKRKGVDLEEADGSQDIGQSYGFLEPGSGSESGTIFDYWYQGNDAPMRRHDTAGYTPTSFPNSMTNDFANSHITIRAFSSRGPRMTAKILIGDEQASPLTGFPKNISRRVGSNSITIPEYAQIMLVNTENLAPGSDLFKRSGIYGWTFFGQPIFEPADTGGIIYESENNADLFAGSIAAGELDGDGISDITVGADLAGPGGGQFTHTVRGWGLKDGDSDLRVDEFFVSDISLKITTTPLLTDSLIVYGAAQGVVYFFDHDGNFSDSAVTSLTDLSQVVGIALLGDRNTFVTTSRNGTVTIIRRNGAYQYETDNFSTERNISTGPVCGLISSASDVHIVSVTDDGYMYLFDSQLNLSDGFPVALTGDGTTSPALADINMDGSADIIVFSGNEIFAVNRAGAVLDNFPVRLSTENPLLSSPVIADINADGKEEIIAVTQEGLVFAYGYDGKNISGFPLLAGKNSGSVPAVFYMDSPCNSCVDIGLVVASDDGYVYAWRTGILVTGPAAPPVMSWPQYLQNGRKTGMTEKPLSGTPRTNEFFPSSLAYNWPNPVNIDHNFITYIRYYIRESAKVHIKIFDGSGDMIAEFDGPGRGGIENEISWNVSGISSGIYFANIEATGAGGNEGSAIIKIAVVK